jgi:hypothetical protein
MQSDEAQSAWQWNVSTQHRRDPIAAAHYLAIWESYGRANFTEL